MFVPHNFFIIALMYKVIISPFEEVRSQLYEPLDCNI